MDSYNTLRFTGTQRHDLNCLFFLNQKIPQGDINLYPVCVNAVFSFRVFFVSGGNRSTVKVNECLKGEYILDRQINTASQELGHWLRIILVMYFMSVYVCVYSVENVVKM